MERLTYRNCGVAYLNYGLDAIWRKMKGYDLIAAAIQKLAEYEDREEEMKTASIFDIHELIEDSMAKKDRYISIYVNENGLSVNVYPLTEDEEPGSEGLENVHTASD